MIAIPMLKQNLSLFCLVLCSLHLAGQPDLRLAPPVILKGEALPDLLDLHVDEIAGFKVEEHEWVQIPIQIDEMDWRLAYDLYNQQVNNNFEIELLVYTDPDKYTGPDENPRFDGNDELVFMAKDAGTAFSGQNWPAAVIGLPMEVRIYDPLTDDYSFVYLFQQDGSLDLAAGADYVSYEYQLLSGDFLETYVYNSYNPENSIAQTDYYTQRYQDDWIRDVLKISAGNANNADILDQAKILLGPGQCNRSIDTYSGGTGVHIASKDGPVRGIRSVMGANSGPLIERNHYFYEQMDVLETWVRLHFIRGFLRFLDLSTQAEGMKLYNAFLPNGVTIDGLPETLNAWQVSNWALFAGEQGSLLRFDELAATFPVDTFLTYYLDDATPMDDQCTGDNKSIGAYGHWLMQNIPDTDPRSGSQEIHFYRETSHFLPENQTPDDVIRLREEQHKALEIMATTFSPNASDELAEPSVFLKLSPNPARDALSVLFPANLGSAQVSLRALDGHTLWSGTMEAGQVFQLPAALPAGLYLIDLQTEAVHLVEKLIVL